MHDNSAEAKKSLVFFNSNRNVYYINSKVRFRERLGFVVSCVFVWMNMREKVYVDLVKILIADERKEGGNVI